MLWIIFILSTVLAVAILDNAQHALEMKLTADQAFNLMVFGLLHAAGAFVSGLGLALGIRD